MRSTIGSSVEMVYGCPTIVHEAIYQTNYNMRPSGEVLSLSTAGPIER